MKLKDLWINWTEIRDKVRFPIKFVNPQQPREYVEILGILSKRDSYKGIEIAFFETDGLLKTKGGFARFDKLADGFGDYEKT